MDIIKNTKFDNKKDELQYWKSIAEEYYQSMHRVQQESEEYMLESQQLEREYEATIEQNERKIRELSLAANRIQHELESHRVKFGQLNKDKLKLEKEVLNLNEVNIQMCEQIRDLEQKNDNLEISQRIMEESVNDIEAAFNSAIERNAILELEVDEKETLKEKLQRLLDERRELQQELLVKQRSPAIERSLKKYKSPAPLPPVKSSPRKVKDAESQTSPIKRKIKFKAFRAIYAFCSRSRKPSS